MRPLQLWAAVLFLAVLVSPLLLPATALADGNRRVSFRSLSARGLLTAEGIVTAVHPHVSAFTMRVIRADQQRWPGNAVTVLVQNATDTRVRIRNNRDDDDDDNWFLVRGAAIVADIRVGDRVRVEGFWLNDGRLLALRLDVRSRALVGPVPLPPLATVASGVVIARGSNSLVIVGSDGIQRVVLISPITDIRGNRNSLGAIQPSDFVTVQGVVNADGSVTARTVEVTVSGGTTVSGRITAKSAIGPAFLILNNSLTVNLSSDTRIIGGGVLRSFNDLQVGQTVTVIGSPVTIGGITVGLNARVITLVGW